MDMKAVVLAAVLGALAGVAGSYFLMQQQLAPLHARLDHTPAVVVVDFAKVVASYPEGAEESDLEQLMVNTNNAIVRLREAGYLVLDASSILAAPEDVYLPPELIAK